MAGYTGIYDEDQVNSGGLLGPELTTQVGIKGRQAGDDITSKFLNFAAGAEGTPPERITPGPVDAPEIKPANRITLPGRESIGGYPVQPEHRTMAGESSIGPEYTGDQQAIPERNAPATPSDQISKAELSGGRTQYNTPEGPAIAGPERFFDANMKEVAAGTPGARSGDELARRGILERASIGEQELRKEVEGGMPARRTLAEKEAAEGGGEFNFDKFHAALKAMGGNVGKKTALSVFEHMYGGHLEEQRARARMKELGLTHGPESPYAKNIASEIDYRSAQAQHMAQMAPLERQQKIEDIAHKIAETEAIPYQTALVKEHINYYKSISESPWMRENKGVMDVLLKEFEADPFSPEGKRTKAQLDGLVSQSIGRRAISASIAKMNETTGAKIDDPPIPGKIYEVPGKGRIRLNKDTQTWENLR